MRKAVPMSCFIYFLSLFIFLSYSYAVEYNLKVDSKPQGATIFINDAQKAQKTPASFTYPAGDKLKIAIKKECYQKWEKVVTMTSQDVEIVANLIQADLLKDPIELRISESNGITKEFIFRDKDMAEKKAVLKIKAFNPGEIHVISLLMTEGWTKWEPFSRDKDKLENKSLELSFIVDGKEITRSVFAKEVGKRIEVMNEPLKLTLIFSYDMEKPDDQYGLSALMRKRKSGVESKIYQYLTAYPKITIKRIQRIEEE